MVLYLGFRICEIKTFFFKFWVFLLLESQLDIFAEDLTREAWVETRRFALTFTFIYTFVHDGHQFRPLPLVSFYGYDHVWISGKYRFKYTVINISKYQMVVFGLGWFLPLFFMADIDDCIHYVTESGGEYLLSGWHSKLY